MDVFLDSSSFVAIVTSAVEGFKSEVAGLLFGDEYHTSEKMIVNQVIPLQIARRKPTSVEINTKRASRVLNIWDNLTTFWPLGCFHSHPSYGGKKYSPSPSEGDIEMMVPSEIEIIIAISKAKRRNTLGYKKDDMRISGAIDEYHIEIAGWFIEENEDDLEDIELIEAEMWCPFIDIINLSYNAGLVKRPGWLIEPDSIVDIVQLRKLRRQVSKYEQTTFRKGTDWGLGSTRKEILRTLKKCIIDI